MRKLTSTFAATAHDPRTPARLILAFVASVLVVLLALMGMGSGPGGTLAFAQDPEPTETEPPSTEPVIQLLNPWPYDHGSPTADPPAISDADDGVDELYHLVAWTANTPSNAIVEAYFTPMSPLGVPLPEVTIGQLFPVPGAPDTWELFWDIPESIDDGPGEITVRMFTDTILGTEEVANDTVEVDMEKDAFAAELTWPTQNGELGFYKPRGGIWRTVIDVANSPGHYTWYTKSAPGQEPEWVQCAGFSTSERRECPLAEGDLPSEVTAVSVTTDEAQDILIGAVNTTESSDTHRVRGYAVTPEEMSIELSPIGTSDTGGTFRQVVGADPDTDEPHSCIALLAFVRDDNNREVLGANVDVHAVGPDDQLQFGDEDSAGLGIVEGGSSSAYKTPDRGSHVTEAAENCDRVPEDETESHTEKPVEGNQGDHNVPGSADTKHRESDVTGTGKSGGSGTGFGGWTFHLFSPNVGTTEVTAWIDDEPITTEGATRPADSDTREEDEAAASATLQWLPGAITVSFDPPGDTAQVGTCNRYVVQVRGGTEPVRGINLDVHATGPTNELDFCDPGDGTPRRAPNTTGAEEDHEAEDDGEAHHRGDPPQTQHTEGETDDSGNFVIGITSPVTGDTVLEAWVDGERGSDDDTLDGEPTGRATKSWAGSLADAQVSFVNPSAYGGSGTNVSNKQDADTSYHIVTRVDSFEAPGVELFISDDDGATFSKIGDATRVGETATGGTDTWEMFWGVNVPDAEYVLRAQITGTNRNEDQTITVNNQDETDDNPTDLAFETLELTRPDNGQSTAFTNRETVVEGIASAGTEGVDLFYTKVAAKDTPQEADWIACGAAEPTADNSFQGACELQGADQASSVTGIAAITFDCDVDGCNPGPVAAGVNDSGDAHRVFGFEGRPRVTIEPAESGARPDACQRLVLSVDDETGQPIGGQNVDVHLTGPNDNSHFCTPGTGGTARRAPDQGEHSAGQGDEGVHGGSPNTKHTEGETNSSGRFVFGVTSPVRGDSQIEGWVDQTDDDVRVDEPGANAVVHWGRTSGSSRECTIQGTSGPDRLIGTPGDDVICGGAGKDEIRGRGGDDIIFGDAGHDDIRGNKGDDRILGGRGRDIIRASYGRDTVRGGAQNDIITGFEGNDRLIGGGGDDSIRAGRGRDVLKGGAGNDTLNGGRGIDRCRGGRGRDTKISCER